MKQPSDVARAWWRELEPAERARLRRCRAPTDALVLRETLALIRSLAWWQRPERAAALAMVLAHVSVDDSRPLMRACGRRHWNSEDALLSEARFLRIMSVRDLEDLMSELARLLGLTDGAGNIADIATAIQWWNDRTRTAWAQQYYAATSDEDSNNG
jgi:CRISPR type I-E-associated protein CasB/Cse2